MDFERADFNAITTVWPETRIRFCSFHLIQILKRKIEKLFPVQVPKKDDFQKKIKKVLLALPYVQWDQKLVEILSRHLHDLVNKNFRDVEEKLNSYEVRNDSLSVKKRKLAYKERKQAVMYMQNIDLLDEFLKEKYLSEEHVFGYKNWCQIDIYEETGDDDFTNNSCETINALFKTWSTSGYKTYETTIGVMYDFMCSMINRTSEMENSKLNSRANSIQEKLDARNIFIEAFQK